MATSDRKPWRKILYEPQPYPDNFVDTSFLEELKKNRNMYDHCHDYVLIYSLGIPLFVTMYFYFLSISLFITMYFYMEDQTASPQTLWCVASIVTIIGYLINLMIDRRSGLKFSRQLFWQHARSCFLFQALSMALSPILVSLTETISTDTIYAMTTVMLLANFLFYNYNYSEEGHVPGPLSLNAGVFASVCLASRLHTAWHAFTTVTVSFQLFALGPSLRRNLKLWWPEVHLASNLVTVVACLAFLATKSVVGAVLYLLATLFIMAVCPLWLFSLQKHKNNIYGPWDEAVIKGSR
ncbi:hypothetical protein EGW08_013336 [Elysia chlorotica]|uniref:Phosphatidylinositol N-acetylglucosaminyltransferase subunit C n=1 Tax=Elysia chlorotica TaxID=188477 RepID=A0A3S0ZN91_ELYCH|nr:hypothetical protein EGW08_013336 [Elysia chlorotica]